MEYSIQSLSKMAGVSTRTLRYYDEIGILKPARISSSGYRIYSEKEVDLLQQILFYKELGMELKVIKEILSSPSFDVLEALYSHKEGLLKKRAQIDLLIQNVENTIDSKEGGKKMANKDKFNGFKKELIDKNEKKYGKEIREKYGDKTVDDSNKKLMNMDEEKFDEFKKLEADIIEVLKLAMDTGNPRGELAMKACELHKKWLGYTWNFYSKEAHRNLGEMYVCDERFKKYYDDNREGMAEFLRDALIEFTK
ncbi:MAG: MerR family transcriptional regulator [Intestinibacter sp.]|uniref:MerR family transcriptional regulator n=1 Tax=Intestinibacter sp. TaxID=1965304 RepID=UPI002A815BA5|nr:MerR family transcriptional regulator [Intestinibacter sp.]MDY4574066.1 MerR family transcriptional regulator [Intestinibacter sp.]